MYSTHYYMIALDKIILFSSKTKKIRKKRILHLKNM